MRHHHYTRLIRLSNRYFLHEVTEIPLNRHLVRKSILRQVTILVDARSTVLGLFAREGCLLINRFVYKFR